MVPILIFNFTNCLIRFDDSNDNFTGDVYDFNNIELYTNVIFNDDPEFLDPNANMLQIPDGSPADNTGIPFGILSGDILNMTRGDYPRSRCL